MHFSQSIRQFFLKLVDALIRVTKLPLLASVDNLDFASIPRMPCDSTRLVSRSEFDLQKIFSDNAIEAQWEKVQALPLIQKLPQMSHGINPGDRRALFSLISSRKPRSILEVGTHIGSSTTTIALALKQYYEKEEAVTPPVISVDIADVNSPTDRPWLDYGAEQSPKSSLEQLGCGDLVTFVTGKSTDYMGIYTTRRFDFIFLDGAHSAEAVYREIPLALNLLNKNGVILLHDFFPNGEPLWPPRPAIPGPFLAVARYRKEGAELMAQSLGELPWETKLNSNKTSLALLFRP